MANPQHRSIQSKETKFEGTVFRSRTEARWALFFHALGVAFEYERERIRLSNGETYLPDFYLPEFRAFFEVKADNDAIVTIESARARRLAADRQGHRVWLAAGAPSYDPPNIRSIEITQLAASLDQTATGGTFRGRLGAAKMFGLIDYKGDTVTLTKLGEAIIDPIRTPGARVEAFLRVPLYERLYEQYKGYPLPNAAAIQRQMVLLGVPQKQVERARQAFAQSVQIAGFINSAGRMVKPVVSQRPDSGGEYHEAAGVRRNVHDQDDQGGRGGRVSGGHGGGGGGPPPANASEMLLALLDPETMSPEETQAVWTLLLYVKKPKKTAADQ